MLVHAQTLSALDFVPSPSFLHRQNFFIANMLLIGHATGFFKPNSVKDRSTIRHFDRSVAWRRNIPKYKKVRTFAPSSEGRNITVRMHERYIRRGDGMRRVLQSLKGLIEPLEAPYGKRRQAICTAASGVLPIAVIHIGPQRRECERKTLPLFVTSRSRSARFCMLCLLQGCLSAKKCESAGMIWLIDSPRLLVLLLKRAKSEAMAIPEEFIASAVERLSEYVC